MKLTQRFAVLSLVMLVVVLFGCGKSDNSVAVNGRVTYRGEALKKGSVTFFGTTGRPVIAQISETGDYEANLPPDDYTVIVLVGADVPAGYKEGDPLPPPQFELPPEYTSRARSTLMAKVAAGQAEPINFELK